MWFDWTANFGLKFQQLTKLDNENPVEKTDPKKIGVKK